MKLTKTIIDSLEPRAEPYREPDDALPRFYVRVMPSGVKTFGYTFRQDGRQHWPSIGRVGTLTLHEARRIATEKLGEVAAGRNPATEKAERRHAALEARTETFTAVAERFLAHCEATGRRRSTITTYRHVLLRSAPASWRKRPVSEITRRDHLRWIDSLIAQGKGPTAHLTQGVLSAFFRFCRERDLVAVSPTEGIRLDVPPPSRDRALSVDELRRVWRAAQTVPGAGSALLQILILAGQRIGETRKMRWSDLEGPTWRIAAANAKNRHPHVVPLSPEAMAVITAQPKRGPFVFTFDGEKPMSAEPAYDAKRAVDRTMGEPALAPWRVHDLRRSLVTGMHEHGLADPHTIELVVNHVGGLRAGIAGIYDKSSRMDARRRALEAWAKMITTGESDVSNVVPLRAAQ